MTNVELNPGICKLTTYITVNTVEFPEVIVTIDSKCSHIQNANIQDIKINIQKEFSNKLHNTIIYKTLSRYIPHISCPIYTSIFKAIEVETGLVLAEKITINFKSKK